MGGDEDARCCVPRMTEPSQQFEAGDTFQRDIADQAVVGGAARMGDEAFGTREKGDAPTQRADQRAGGTPDGRFIIDDTDNLGRHGRQD